MESIATLSPRTRRGSQLRPHFAQLANVDQHRSGQPPHRPARIPGRCTTLASHRNMALVFHGDASLSMATASALAQYTSSLHGLRSVADALEECGKPQQRRVDLEAPGASLVFLCGRRGCPPNALR